MDTKEFGQRVADQRRLRGMSQGDLATAIGRSESWVSQVERGVYPVERISILQSLADALGVSMQELRADAPPSPDAPGQASEPQTSLEQLRLALSGHPVPAALFCTAAPVAVDASGLALRAEQAWSLEHSGEYEQLNAVLPEVLIDLERASRQAKEAARPAVLSSLARAYQVAAATFSRRDEPDAAWVAADRAIAAAERSGQPLQVLAGHFRMAHAFMRLNQLAQAEHVASAAAAALEPRIAQPDATSEELSLFGAMNLVLALLRAREGDRAGAKDFIQRARDAAARNGVDRNDFNTEFGPTNVELHALTVAIEVGDAGEALDIASGVDPSGLSPERQARFWLDVGRAQAQRRHVGDAVAAIRKAEQLAPEQILGHHLTRETVALLVQLAGRRQPAELADLARRTSADL
jgi:transcriptional regulator with XRE-family HTH domain